MAVPRGRGEGVAAEIKGSRPSHRRPIDEMAILNRLREGKDNSVTLESKEQIQ